MIPYIDWFLRIVDKFEIERNLSENIDIGTKIIITLIRTLTVPDFNKPNSKFFNLYALLLFTCVILEVLIFYPFKIFKYDIKL